MGKWPVGGWVLLGLCKKKKNITGEWFKKEKLYLIYLNLTYSSSQTWKQNKQTQTIGNVFLVFFQAPETNQSHQYLKTQRMCGRRSASEHCSTMEGGVSDSIAWKLSYRSNRKIGPRVSKRCINGTCKLPVGSKQGSLWSLILFTRGILAYQSY